MADYEIFREQLAIKYPSYGYALWEPSPTNPNRPVQVGDVGFIREGRFYRLFCALLPADDPSQELGVPEYHEPLVPTLSDHVATVPLGRNNYCSAGVKVEADPGYHSGPDDFPQVLFQNETTRAAAVLSLPVTTRRKNTLIRNLFGRWMVKHIDTWFAFARNLGLIHQMEEMILVTGCDLTRSWTNVAFLRGADAQVSFGVKVEGRNTSVNFQFSPEHSRVAVLHHGPEGTNLPENQCVFIRGFRVAPSLWILPKRLKAAAGPSGDPGVDDREVISIPATTQFRDPLYLLSDYIAEQAPDCDKILVHDDDLLMIDGIGHGTLLETLDSDVVVDLLRKSDIKIHKFGCDSFLIAQTGEKLEQANVYVKQEPGKVVGDAISSTTASVQNSKDQREFSEKYYKLQREHWELEEKYKDLEDELGRSVKRDIRWNTERGILLDRILELEAIVAGPSISSPPNIYIHAQTPNAFPRKPRSDLASTAFEANLEESLDEFKSDDPLVDPLYTSRHSGPLVRKRQLEEMKEEEEEARDARKAPRRDKATTAVNQSKAKDTSAAPPFPPPQNPTTGSTATVPTIRHANRRPLKAHTVTSKSYYIPMVPRYKDGKPILPLNVEIFTVSCLGEVCMREHFHTERYIFPVGYSVSRRYLSTREPNAETVYNCTILDAGDGPKFQIVANDMADKPIIAGTATGAWSVVVRAANHVRNRQHSNSVSGPEFFGLGQNTIKHLIQELPGADRLKDYAWQNFIEGSSGRPLGGRHATAVPAVPEEGDFSLPS